MRFQSLGVATLLAACAEKEPRAAPTDVEDSVAVETATDAGSEVIVDSAPDSTLDTAPDTAPSATPAMPGGRFGFVYPNFTMLPGAMTPSQYVESFAAAMHNPNVFRQWVTAGTDIRRLNPGGAYLKHISLRTIDSKQLEPSIEGHPDYAYVHDKHPEWIVRDAAGKTVPIFVPSEESLDFGNDAYLDWVLSTWMPNNYLDVNDNDIKTVSWYLQDNGVFNALPIKCAAGDAVCARYATDEGVRTAWEHMLDRFKARWPNKRVLVNCAPVTYKPVADQVALYRRILAHADGYFSEFFTNDHTSWGTQPNDGKRIALATTMQTAAWLADNGKAFFPNLGMFDNIEPTQPEVDYAWAFFNILRRGELQFFSRVTKDTAGNWQPRIYPEMTLSLGAPLGAATESPPNVFQREYEKAIAVVNISDASVTVDLPAGSYKDASGKTIATPLVIASFRGLTVYR